MQTGNQHTKISPEILKPSSGKKRPGRPSKEEVRDHKFLVAKQLHDSGMSATQACQKADIAKSTYLDRLKKQKTQPQKAITHNKIFLGNEEGNADLCLWQFGLNLTKV
jgi:hypothetical protein